MTHDLKSPINGILTYCEIIENNLKKNYVSINNINMELSDDIRDDDVYKNIKTLKNIANTLLLLVRDILDYSLIKNGTLRLFPQPVKLGEIINEIVSYNSQ